MKNNKTTVVKGNSTKRSWNLVDLSGQSWGRSATKIAPLLIGKHKIDYSPNRDAGDYVVAINASKISITGKKLDQKIYYHHSGFTGNLKELTLRQLFKKDPRQVIYLAVRGMLPKNKLRSKRLTRLKIFIGDQHQYTDKFKK
jgi:large subunit ribosomal protein L13